MKSKLDEELQFLESSTSTVKKTIYQKTFKQKRGWSRTTPVLQIAALVILIVSAFLLASTLMEQEKKANPVPLDYPVIDKRTLDIVTYETFYTGPSFLSSYNASYRALSDTLSMYALFNYLDDVEYEWTEESEELTRQSVKRAWEYDKQDEELQQYYSKMFKTLGITEDEYIEHYLYLRKKGDMMYNGMFQSGVGVDETGAYPSGEAYDAYIEEAGYSLDDLNAMAEKVLEKPEPMQPQPDLAFLQHVEEGALQITQNDSGDYIFVDPETFFIDLAFSPYQDLLYVLKTDKVDKDLSRLSLDDYKAALQEFPSDDPNYQVAQELLEMFVILERSIEKDLEI